MSEDGFRDHFSAQASHYAAHRPHYPAALFEWLAQHSPAHDLAWDCGTGNGQAALGLSRHFSRVVATDASKAQIALATPHPAIEYRVAPAEHSGLVADSVDVVSVAQAAHWFDLPAFYSEVERVLKPGGLCALWCYGVLDVEGAAVNAQVQRFYAADIGPYWPPERVHVENGYRDLPFPFKRIATPAFEMSAQWTRSQLMGYLRSWSATQAFMQQNGLDPVASLETALSPLWGEAHDARRIRWPLTLIAGGFKHP